MHLEQVWSRYKRLSSVLESVFDYLDDFTWRHRLPKVAELLRDHMKRSSSIDLSGRVTDFD